MSRFDERAEGAAVARRRDNGDGDSNNFTAAEVRALKRALGTQRGRLEDDLSSLEVLLHSDPGNPNAPVEQGPPQPDSPTFKQAVAFYHRVADDIRAIRSAVSRITIDQGHKQDLLEGLYYLAKTWDERGNAFGTGDDPASAAAKYRTARDLEKDAAPARRVLNLYFPEAAERVES